ncbi:MAG TPA: hypothetical protein VMC84_02285 [Methanocella sp.]|uniref:hypothetical protein n=1 Tax=Methanocella sp. TaxID=2052833 RepID=UPI002C9B3195|nr:hypothetical protein [Methanocella sp.]HTY89981.1 hypothetical protein [Methanocella sp.]
MSRKYLVYLAIALATALAGCIFLPGAPAGNQAGNSVAPLIPLPAAGPSVTQVPAEQAATYSPFDLDAVSWAEYRRTANGGPVSDVRLEYSSSQPGGGKMVSIKRTQTSGGASSLSTQDGGRSYSMRYSSSQSSTSSNMMPAGEMMANDPVLYADGLKFSGPVSTESITVPRGTYNCEKYATSFKGSGAIYWGAAGVPIPVKIYTSYDGATLELADWG